MADDNGVPFNKVQANLDDLQRSLTVAHIKDAMPTTAPTQSGPTQQVQVRDRKRNRRTTSKSVRVSA